jgi:hypothetical protein
MRRHKGRSGEKKTVPKEMTTEEKIREEEQVRERIDEKETNSK